MGRTSILALLASAAMVSTPAVAQTTSEQPNGQDPKAGAPNETFSSSDDIIVTAQKRSERLQDVPLAVTAVTGEALAARQINDTSSLVQAVPSLTFQQAANPVASSFRIRGIGTSLFGLGNESSVALVVDGVVSARQTQNFTDFADIERVEVLRGPQGTLFGKNATAGVISVVTERPSRTLEARGSLTVAEMGEYRASGTVSGPLTDTIGVRLTGYYNDVGGNIRNVLTGHDANATKSWGLRGKLEWRPSDALTFLLAGDYRKSDANCCQNVLVKIGNPFRALLTGPITVRPDSDQVWNNDQTYVKSDQQTYSLQSNLDLGSATLTSITAYQRYHLIQNQEVDAFGLRATCLYQPGIFCAVRSQLWQYAYCQFYAGAPDCLERSRPIHLRRWRLLFECGDRSLFLASSGRVRNRRGGTALSFAQLSIAGQFLKAEEQQYCLFRTG